jgi:hypothetical protein
MALAGPPRNHENLAAAKAIFTSAMKIEPPPTLFSHQCVEVEFSEVHIQKPT